MNILRQSFKFFRISCCPFFSSNRGRPGRLHTAIMSYSMKMKGYMNLATSLPEHEHEDGHVNRLCAVNTILLHFTQLLANGIRKVQSHLQFCANNHQPKIIIIRIWIKIHFHFQSFLFHELSLPRMAVILSLQLLLQVQKGKVLTIQCQFNDFHLSCQSTVSRPVR